MKKQLLLSLLLLFFCCAAVRAAAPGGVPLGYCSDQIAGSIGANATKKIAAAIYVPAEVAAAYAGNRVTGVSFGLTGEVSDASVFITEELGGTAAAEQACATSGTGWQHVTLSTPYVVTGNGFYVGYAATGYNQIGRDEDVVSGACWLNTGGEWTDYAQLSAFPALSLRCYVEGEQMPMDLSLSGLKGGMAKTGESHVLTGELTNYSPVEATSYEVTCAFGDDAPVSRTFASSIPSMGSASFSLEVPVPATVGDYALTVSITAINGVSGADALPSNSTSVLTIKARDQFFPRKFVMEEGTGTWCGWCPRGIVAMREMKAKHPDDFIGIAAHTSDQMAASNYQGLHSAFFSGYPSAVINRDPGQVIDPSPEAVEAAYEKMDKQTDMGIGLSAEFADETRKKLNVTSLSTFGFSAENAKYRVAFVVLENGVTGYVQSNNYAGGGQGEMGGFESMGANAVIDFDDVARGIYKAYAGSLNSLPKTIEPNTPYRFDYAITLPSSVQNPDNLEVAALLVNASTGIIENAAKVKVGEATAGIAQLEDGSALQPYAKNGRAVIDGDCDTLRVYTADGREVRNESLSGGTFIVRVSKGNHVVIRKLLFP